MWCYELFLCLCRLDRRRKYYVFWECVCDSVSLSLYLSLFELQRVANLVI